MDSILKSRGPLFIFGIGFVTFLGYLWAFDYWAQMDEGVHRSTKQASALNESSLEAGTLGLRIGTDRDIVPTLAPNNVALLPFTAFQLANNTDRDITVDGVDIRVSELADNSAIAEVALVDELGFKVGSSKQPDSRRAATIGDSFVVPAGMTKRYTVAADIAECGGECVNSGKTVTIRVVALSTPGILFGELPVIGAAHTLNGNLKIGNLKVSLNDLPNVTVHSGNNKGFVFVKMRLAADGVEDVTVHSLRFKYAGTADASALSNLRVKINEDTHPAVWSLNGAYVTASILDSVKVHSGAYADVTFEGDVALGSDAGKTIRFDIEDASDVYVLGKTYGFGIQPTAAFSTSGTPWFMGNTFTLFR